MIVSRYGLHIAEGIPFLLQRSGAINLISPDLPCPFQAHIRPRNERCPHDFNLNAVDPAPAWVSEPLVQAFLPTPGTSAVWVYDPDNKLGPTIAALRRLSSPTYDSTTAIWMKATEWVKKLYEVTNLGPMVFTSAEVNHTEAVNRHAAVARACNRRLVVIARERMPLFDMKRVEPFDLDLSQPFERIGAGLLRSYMEDVQNGRIS
ncbi:hypothetical protein CPT_Seuss75 [Caulobacter phage Seuss]|uniref:Uncharacterized protein n=1 Tax=Caulobacter phage Seuss TaxID=1675601 RepID=A0A0K1LM73_9CAUD|nr:hypothetical protein HOR08_gp075 [Caulobacter phage Seuss]AKU43601.1 hypothetical protein CPT_Seuss75 [Caulobacter phage Seuss]